MNTPQFNELGLSKQLTDRLASQGYLQPTPVQALGIPVLLAGKDLLAQAETGTGKTAAFALPTLMKIDLLIRQPQALILAPTRELAIQVAQAFENYATDMKGLTVLCIYGGQDYRVQLKGLKQGAHVIVGTPGRVIDHLERGTLLLDHLKMLVLDEADEMLKMGFQEDVEFIMQKAPSPRQTALFSATVPAFIHKLVKKYLNEPEKIEIKAKADKIPTIRQSYVSVTKQHKFEALRRFLAISDFEAAIIFVQTKAGTLEITEKLSAAGYAVAALNGDIKQSQREAVITQLKNGRLNMVVATDVAARGLDVPRLNWVMNYDPPHDAESYVHRIGRTGRAGRQGDALLFISPREKGILKKLEQVTGQPVHEVSPPSLEDLNQKQANALTEKLAAALKTVKPADLKKIDKLAVDLECSIMDVAAALLTFHESEPQVGADIVWSEAGKSEGGRRGEGERGRSSYEGRRERGGSREGRPDRDRSSSREGRPDRDRSSSRGEGRPDRDRSSSREGRPDRGFGSSSRGEGRPDRDRSSSREGRPDRGFGSSSRGFGSSSRGEGRPDRDRSSSRGEGRPDRDRSSSREGRPDRGFGSSSRGEGRPERERSGNRDERRSSYSGERKTTYAPRGEARATLGRKK